MTRRSLALAVLSGLLLAASFPSLGYSFLAWFALVPLLFALRDQTVRTGLWLSVIFGLVFFCGTVYWVTNSIHVYGHVPLLPAIAHHPASLRHPRSLHRPLRSSDRPRQGDASAHCSSWPRRPSGSRWS